MIPSDDGRKVTVSGRSMWPLLREGDEVMLREVPIAEIIPGDIVAFGAGDITLLHRVIGLEQAGAEVFIREKGDNTRVSTRVPAASLLGVAVERIRGASRCALRKPPSAALRLLTWGSRAEACVFETLRASRRHILPSRDLDQATPFGRAASLLFMPLRLPGLILLQLIYRAERRSDDAAARWSLDAFRAALAGRAPPAWPGDAGAALDELRAQGILSLVADRGAGQGGTEWVPDSVRDAVRMERYRAGLLHLAAQATMQEVARALGDEGMEHVFLKGPPLSAELYGEGALRPSTDIDVLVRAEDLERAVAALERRGFGAKGSGWQQALVKRGHFHIVLRSTMKGRVPVELHWELVDRANLYRVDAGSVFHSRRLVNSGGVRVPVPGLEQGLIYLCLHLAKHALFNRRVLKQGPDALWFLGAATGNRLIWFADLHLYIARHSAAIDWRLLRETAVRWNVMDDVACCLRALDLVVPDETGRAALKRLDVRVCERGGASRAVQRRSGGGRLMSALLKADERFVVRPARLLTVGELLWPSSDRMRDYYSVRHWWNLPLLYVRHPFHMIRKVLGGRRVTRPSGPRPACDSVARG